MTDENDNIFILVDENGEEVEFEHLDTLSYKDEEYIVLLPMVQEEEDADEVVILKTEAGEDGDLNYISVDDENEVNAVFELFKARMEDEYEFES